MANQPVPSVARDTVLMFAVQALLLVAQLGYGAFTSRTFEPAVFGAYAVAMACLSLGTRIAATGVTNAAARRGDEDRHRDRELLGWAVVLGLTGTLVMLALSAWLAGLWGDPQSLQMIRLVSPAILLGAYAGALTGLLRRHGGMRRVTALTLISGLVALLVGLLVVQATRNPLALTTVPLLTPALLAVGAAVSLRGGAVPAWPTAAIGADIRFSALSSLNSVGIYALNIAPLVVLSRVAGPATLGSWNRAVAFTQVPVETAMRSWSLSAFPHLRAANGRRGWTDLTGSGLLVLLPVGLAVAPAVPVGLRILLGPGWQTAEAMGTWLWLASVVTAVSTLLVTVAESTGRFRVLLTAQLSSAGVFLIAALALWRTGAWQTLAAGALMAAIAYFAGAAWQAHAAQLLDGRACLRWTVLAAGAGVGLAILPGVSYALGNAALTLVLAAGCAAAWLALCYWSRHRWSPLAGLMGGGHSDSQG